MILDEARATLKPFAEWVTQREFEVLRLIVQGYRTKEIAARFGLSPRTVEIYNGHLVRKLHARSIHHLAALAIQRGWITDEVLPFEGKTGE